MKLDTKIKSSDTIARLFMICSCLCISLSCEKHSENIFYQIENETIASNQTPTLNEPEDYYNFINTFMTLCELNTSVGVSSKVQLNNLRNDFMELFPARSILKNGEEVIMQNFIVSQKYNKSIKALLTNTGFIFLTNQMIINRAENDNYYLIWKNKITFDKKQKVNRISPLIDHTTIEIFTNLNKNNIRHYFNYTGDIHSLNIDSLIVNYDSLSNNIKISNYPT